jgi:phosphoribosylformylglycinamidine cyclo-ligase
MSGKTPLTYADAGVSIATGNAFVQRISRAVAATKRAGVCEELGGFGGVFDLKACNMRDPLLVSGTDGVGTKLLLALAAQHYSGLGADLVAMCANDVVTRGAQPLFFLDYFATGKLDPEVATAVVESIAHACAAIDCALLGGETAEMPGFYAEGHFDLAGFCVGAVERDALLPRSNTMQAGDSLVALPSSGPHANGYSLIRAVIAREGLDLHAPCPWQSDTTVAQALLTPTTLYVKPCLTAFASGLVTGAAHITGGGLTDNVPRILPAHLRPQYSLPALPAWAQYMQEAAALDDAQMHLTFNCGWGMVFVTAHPDKLCALLQQHQQTPTVIGQLVAA